MTTPLIAKFVIQPYVLAKIQLIDKLNENERQLQLSEERYSLVSKNTNDGFFDWDYINHKIYYSDRWIEFMGYTQSIDSINKTSISPDDWMSRVHPEDHEQFTQALYRSFHSKNESKFKLEFRIRLMSGEYSWVLMRWSVLKDKNENVIRIIGSKADINEQKKLEEKLILNATTDTLTGLNNRRVLNEKIKSVIEKKTSSQHNNVALILIDLDRFKQINDTLGHNAGDELLIQISKRLTDASSQGDTICRLGGDEFAILHSTPSNQKETAKLLTDNILKSMGDLFNVGGICFYTSLSIGVAYILETHDTTESVIRDADIALW